MTTPNDRPFSKSKTIPGPGGLRPTLRQMMIFTLFLALVFGATRYVLRWEVLGNQPEFYGTLIPLLLAAYPIPLLCALLFALDRRGPVRSWYIAWCLASWGLWAGIMFLLQDLACIVLLGTPTLIFPLAPIIAFLCLSSLTPQLRLLRRGRCLHCGEKTVIPTSPPLSPDLAKKFKRLQSGWCATCGADYERENTSPWRLKAAEAD